MKVKQGVITGNTKVIFEKAEVSKSQVKLGIKMCMIVLLTSRHRDITRTCQVCGRQVLSSPEQNLRDQHQVQILGSSSQTLKYIILDTAIAEMSNFIEVDHYIL